MVFGAPQPPPQDPWRLQLDRFATLYQVELAALAWKLWHDRPSPDQFLGIDLLGPDRTPSPRFVYCPRSALETLNNQAANHLQEVLGLVDAHQPDLEVLILAIGDGQVKLIHYQPDPPPPDCFVQVAQDVDVLLEQLEQHLARLLS